MPDQQLPSEDYINLPGFTTSIKHFFHFIFWVWAYLLLVLSRNKFLVLAGLVVGLLLGYLYYASKPTFYKATLVVQNNELTKKTYAEILKQLNNLATTGTTAKLSTELGTSEQMAANILYIDSRNMNDDPLSSDTSSRLRQPFKIIAGLKDYSLSDTIQALLLKHLNNRPYLKTLREEQTKLYYARLAFLHTELAKLDTLKSEYNHFLASAKISATFYNNAFNPADVYLQSNNLFNQREITMRLLFIDKDAVVLIDGFKTTSSPHSISLLKALLILGSAGFLIAFLFAFLKETRKRLG
jgi:hypothetical protein